jgi:hypothetical protein
LGRGLTKTRQAKADKPKQRKQSPRQFDAGFGEENQSKTVLTNTDDSPAVIHLTESEFPF